MTPRICRPTARSPLFLRAAEGLILFAADGEGVNPTCFHAVLGDSYSSVTTMKYFHPPPIVCAPFEAKHEKAHFECINIDIAGYFSRRCEESRCRRRLLASLLQTLKGVDPLTMTTPDAPRVPMPTTGYDPAISHLQRAQD